MKIGETYIQRAYYGQQLLTPKSAFVGRVPLIEDLQPDIWLPFSSGLNLSQKGKILSLPATIDSNFYRWDNVMTLLIDGGAKQLQQINKGVGITNWNVPYNIFATARTYNGVYYPATQLTASLWIRLNTADVQAWGVDMTLERNGLILGTPDGYEFFGLLFKTRDNNVIVEFGNRNGGGYAASLPIVTLSFDTWTHVAFSYNPGTRVLCLYLNGQLVNRNTYNYDAVHWIWCLQAPPWTMYGNYRAIQLPFIYKDIRIYGHLLGKEAIKHVYQTTKNT